MAGEYRPNSVVSSVDCSVSEEDSVRDEVSESDSEIQRTCCWQTEDADPMKNLDHMIEKNFKHLVNVPQFSDVAKQIAVKAYFEWLDTRRINHPGHIVIMGNPGIGKTTGAKAFAKFLSEANLVRTATLTSAFRIDLVDTTSVKSKIKTKKLIKDAQGGVIIFEESYTLINPNLKRDAGLDALNVVLENMSSAKAPVMIFTGYKGPMEHLLQAFPRMKKQIRYTIVLEDYTTDQLDATLRHKIKEKAGYESIDDGLHLSQYLRVLPDEYLKRFNATAAERLLEYAEWNARTRSPYFPRKYIKLTHQDFHFACHEIKKEYDIIHGRSPPLPDSYV